MTTYADDEWLFDAIRSGAPGPISPALRALSERELEILRLIASGASNADIAGRRHLSEGTIRTT